MLYEMNEYRNVVNGLLEKIEKAIYNIVSPLDIDIYATKEPVAYRDRFIGEKKKGIIGESWGELWDCAWFNFKGTVPKEVDGKKIVALIDVSGEAFVVDDKGTPIKGLTTLNSEFDYTLGKPGKREIELFKVSKGGEEVNIWADCACNDLFGKYQNNGIIKDAYIAICNEEVKKLYFDIEVLVELLDELPKDSARYHRVLNSLYEASKILSIKTGMSGCEFLKDGIVSQEEINTLNSDEVTKARNILSKELLKKAGDESLTLSAIGHAHIDLAWLWPIRETIRKGARTFSTVLSNMDKYPDYVFGASQPQLYQWMKDEYPELYSKIKERIEEGRWEAQGAMWVEPDTNVPSGESLVRQILYGKRYFREEFNKDMKSLWLPDVFGYSAALPQILKKSGIDYFMTIKLSWNNHNEFPHHTFIWEGLDGSKVLSHMPPEGTYNSSAAPRAVKKAEKAFLDKALSEECLMLFGIGDGGGGPGEEHLERLEREKNLNGLIPVKQEKSLEFFKRIEKDMGKYNIWSGELYLEKHQGTYTTHGKNKMYNRKMEIALRNLELISVQAMLEKDIEYPQEEIEKVWKEVLLYQFHDILPGSSIERVYDESVEAYKKLLNKVEKLTEKIKKQIIENENGYKEGILLTNSLNWQREEWIKLYDKWTKVKVLPLGGKVINKESINNYCEICTLNVCNEILENSLIKIEFYADGSIKGVYDKELKRDVLKSYKNNVLEVYEDNGDAWDFSQVYKDRPKSEFKFKKVNFKIEGPKAIVTQKYNYNKSLLEQNIIITEGSKRIDFETKVNWQEDGKMLRTSFHANVHTREATCEIQFGNIKRSTHCNTSWDMAKGEVCAHKWVDLSQRDYGIALLNDCKYGYNISETTIDLNLLRSPAYPDPNADRGNHVFKYALLPHKGDYIEGNVVKEAYNFNIPLQATYTDKLINTNSIESLLTLDCENIIVESIKKAEFSNDVIVRLYECHGNDAKVKINFNKDYKNIELVNLIEDPIKQEKFDSSKLELKFSPFEVHTLKIIRK
ncbi:alpha-mannosidase [Clostridium tarantellae]|uniref:Alpha-mannosidase n=1 Tax=Clostridium tarantellae TaxID=39493 RepID=A0A6I1MN93_9CLOT|nr:glycoside hydrolase family 38 C-terminal domain-containing protein [Clostridium tarantellae]MPQ44494.1 alpha-mannosidase [Clostridium tarantellae]